MGGEEGFLRRWSRRKHAVRSAPGERATDQRDEDSDHHRASPIPSEIAPAPAQSEPRIPPALPPIETIDRGTDIRPFLAAGVPDAMARAALRRAWSADPAIRDFVGLSENFWDAQSGGGIPGFGSLTVDEARRLLERLTGTPEAAGEKEQSPSTVSEKTKNATQEDRDREDTDG